jgi:5-methyltetrahydrofolate--homocysteine methyltransferase
LLATVKGDVHDIGKNIVGVVMACNNYEIKDIGVMVPTDKILAEAREWGADIIGLSGLITPSLDEMVHVASEMERLGMNTPLLIGGATTSKVHTAVKIAPKYKHPVVHVLDASRSVPVAGNLLNPETKPGFEQQLREEYERMAADHARRQSDKQLLTLNEARANRFQTSATDYIPEKPAFTGVKTVSADLNTLREFIDWTPFFQTWELAGRYPEILHDSIVGEEARRLFADANEMLEEIIQHSRLQAKGVIFIYPAGSTDEDVTVYADEARTQALDTFHFLRQQRKMAGGIPNISLADYIATKESGVTDYLGGFAVTAGIGTDELEAQYDKENDDYKSIMAKALADRLAEAFAEYLHREVRTQWWGYAHSETLSNEDLIRENYRGIRPAPGYPACPEHTEKTTLFKLLSATENAGISLTESMAMLPAAAVSGFYFAHPESQYFGLGKIGKDQVQDYANRKGWTLQEAERWLGPVLSY